MVPPPFNVLFQVGMTPINKFSYCSLHVHLARNRCLKHCFKKCHYLEHKRLQILLFQTMDVWFLSQTPQYSVWSTEYDRSLYQLHTIDWTQTPVLNCGECWIDQVWLDQQKCLKQKHPAEVQHKSEFISCVLSPNNNKVYIEICYDCFLPKLRLCRQQWASSLHSQMSLTEIQPTKSGQRKAEHCLKALHVRYSLMTVHTSIFVQPWKEKILWVSGSMPFHPQGTSHWNDKTVSVSGLYYFNLQMEAHMIKCFSIFFSF